MLNLNGKTSICTHYIKIYVYFLALSIEKAKNYWYLRRNETLGVQTVVSKHILKKLLEKFLYSYFAPESKKVIKEVLSKWYGS